MRSDSSTTHSRVASQSVFANLLALSGYIGLAGGLTLEVYRFYLLDTVLGAGSAPPWIETSRFALIAGSIAVLMYVPVLDDAFEKWLDLVVLCLLIGQWGVPIWLYIDATLGGPGSPYGFFIIASAGIYAVVATFVAINYIRRCWPTLPDISF